MKIPSEKLILELIETTRQNLNFAELLKASTDEELNWKEAPESWSILECLEHLNLYGDYYLPEIERKLIEGKTRGERQFKSGILGNYFAQMMLPKEKMSKMKTFKDKNPLNSNLDRKVIDRFINQQIKMIDLLKRSRQRNLNKEKISTSLARWLKLSLGDSFRVVIYHNIRHMEQIRRIEQKLKLVG